MTSGIIDFHSHVLPGIDDGSASVEESLEMLALSGAQGIGHMVATPHFDGRHDTPERFLARRDRAEDALRQAMEGRTDLPRLTVGAEVAYFPGISQSDALPLLALEGGNAILIELPQAPWTGEIWRELPKIRKNWGLTPIIAHIDRYIAPLRTYGIPQRLAELPVLVQANGEFFLKGMTSGLALRMLKADQVQLLGSDCHNMSARRPDLGAALERVRGRLGEEALERIEEYQKTVFSGPAPSGGEKRETKGKGSIV